MACENCGKDTAPGALWCIDNGAVLVCDECRYTDYRLSIAVRPETRVSDIKTMTTYRNSKGDVMLTRE